MRSNRSIWIQKGRYTLGKGRTNTLGMYHRAHATYPKSLLNRTNEKTAKLCHKATCIRGKEGTDLAFCTHVAVHEVGHSPPQLSFRPQP